MSPRIGRTIRVSLIVAGLGLGLIAGGLGRHSIVRAQNPPTSGPTVDQVIADMHDDFQDMSESLGGLSAEEKTKLAALEKKVGDQMKADPSKISDDKFKNSVLLDFRGILAADHQKKFDAMMEQSRKNALEIQTAARLKQVGLLVILYLNDNQGKSAPDLGALTAEDTSPEIFLSADSKTPLPADWKKMDAKAKAQWVNKNTDFIYLGGARAGNPEANFIIAYVKPEASPDRNTFLTWDGRIFSKSAAESKTIIDDLKAGKNPPPSLKGD